MATTDKPLIWLRLDTDAVVMADVFQKTTQQTPARVIADCKRRLKQYDQLARED